MRRYINGPFLTIIVCFTLRFYHPYANFIPIGKDKPGVCPAVDNTTVGICVNECTDDLSCPGVQKCCSNGCGQVCTTPGAGEGGNNPLIC